MIVFFKPPQRIEPAASDENVKNSYMVARASWVFNADQVEGYQHPDLKTLAPTFELRPILQKAIAQLGVTYAEGGQSAFYRPSTDHVQMPDRARFFDTPSLTAERAFAAALLHELTHATGAKTRLDRISNERITKAGYAFEELIAELGAAYLCQDFGISAGLDDHHAQYIESWLTVLHNDKTAIFTAANAATRAADFIRDACRAENQTLLAAA